MGKILPLWSEREYTIGKSWPSEHLFSGNIVTVILRKPRLGEIAAISFRGGTFFSRLVSCDMAGNIVVVGRTGRCAFLHAGTYQFEGVLDQPN